MAVFVLICLYYDKETVIMVNKVDSRRVRMTKKLLKTSLIEIMKTTPLYSITIKDICDGADVNRSTFYRHYDTQFDLYDDVIEDIAKDIEVILVKEHEGNFDICNFLTKVLEYIESNRDTFLVVLSDKGSLNMGETFNRIIGKFLPADKTTELGTYIVQFIAAGMTSILWNWLSKTDRRSAKEVARLIYALMRHGLRGAFDFSSRASEK